MQTVAIMPVIRYNIEKHTGEYSYMTTLYEGAFAKINLTLDVLDKRADGYHNLKSVMQTISIRDDIEIDSESIMKLLNRKPGKYGNS